MMLLIASSERSLGAYNLVVSKLQHEINALAQFLVDHPRLMVLTGAGISSCSGIPTYRDEYGKWLSRSPIQSQDFHSDEQTRRRYWSRSWYGWPVIRDAQPNGAHLALAQLEKNGHVEQLVTQNVDRLHQKAGSRQVVDLHGRVDRVRCMGCAAEDSRESVQQAMASGNHWPSKESHRVRPDGDMEVGHLGQDMVLPHCQSCGGDIMPDVTFFGGSVPRERVSKCLDALRRADGLLAIGTSFTVYSGYRFCRKASQWGKPIAIINPGLTRADELSQLHLQTKADPLLRLTAEHLGYTW
jgi:NAD-dependent SIR2 family protein deacetylase